MTLTGGGFVISSVDDDCFFLPGPYDLGCIPNELLGLTWPDAPVPGPSETVNTKAELDAAVLVDGNVVTINSGTYVGRLNPLANDLRLIWDNAAVLDGEYELGNVSNRVERFHHSGGCMDTGPFTFDNCEHVLFDNFFGVTLGATLNNLGGQDAHHVAIINTTLKVLGGDSGGSWTMFMGGGGTPRTDWILANNHLETDNSQTCRYQNIDRFVLIDQELNLNGLGANSLRIQEDSKNVWVRDVMAGNGVIFLSGGPDPAITNAVFERLINYTTPGQWATTDAISTGRINGCRTFSENGVPGADMDTSPYVGLDNIFQFWNGVFPGFSGTRGADHELP